MARQRLFVDEHQMKLLRDRALFSDSDYVRFKAVRELSEYGMEAIPLISEIAETTNAALNRFCQDSIEQIQSGN